MEAAGFFETQANLDRFQGTISLLLWKPQISHSVIFLFGFKNLKEIIELLLN